MKGLSHAIRHSLRLIALTLILASPVWAATTVIVGTDPSKTVLKGALVTPEQAFEIGRAHV